MQLSILIVLYNACDLTRRCLASVFEQTRGLEFEVIAVDNASTEPTARMVRDEFPEVQLILLEENVGFGRAVNAAAERARGEFVLLLNPDTIVHDAALVRLVEFARAHPEYGVYGGRTLRADGSVDPSSCWGAPTLWSLFCFATGLSALFSRSTWLDPESLGRWERDSVREVGVVTGCLCLLSRVDWQRLGGFDPRYFMYGEDVDLCLRARESGLRPVITPTATVTHFVGKSSAVPAHKRVMVMRGKATLVRARWSGARSAMGQGLLLAGVWLRAMLGALVGRRDSSWAEVWRQRASWREGYASDAAPPLRERTGRARPASAQPLPG